jgi:hypothetical protein
MLFRVLQPLNPTISTDLFQKLGVFFPPQKHHTIHDVLPSKNHGLTTRIPRKKAHFLQNPPKNTTTKKISEYPGMIDPAPGTRYTL